MKEADDSNYYLKYFNTNYVYVISKETFNNLAKVNSDFFVDKPAETDKNKSESKKKSSDIKSEN